MRTQIAYNMDCMDLMRLVPDKEFDLAIVDPPYGGGATQFEQREPKREKPESKPYRGHL